MVQMAVSGERRSFKLGIGKKYYKRSFERDEVLEDNIVLSERINKLMTEGYFLKEKDELIGICIVWQNLWEEIKKNIPPRVKSIEELGHMFITDEYLFKWCQDYEMILEEAGKKDSSFFEKRIEFCKEFCDYLPDTDELIIHNMKQAIAESYFGLGNVEQGDSAFMLLISEFPNSAWAFLGWGDMYYFYRLNEKVPKDYKKAKKIYQEALLRELDDRVSVIERLAELEAENI